MKYIASYSNEPADNLAYEHYLLANEVKDEPLLFFYINKPSVIIGRHQNAYEQIDLSYVWKKGIPVVRRMSGGGAVYHDYGNLNYSFILPNDDQMLDFKNLTKPILEALHKMGAKDAKLSGRNDLEVDGKKFSGTAMYQKNGHILIHGTLLYKSELSHINEILKVRNDKIASKGVKSVRARVTNLATYLNQQYVDLTTFDFMNALKTFMPDLNNGTDFLEISKLREINTLKTKYYDNHEWNFGKITDWSYRNRKKFSFGELEVAIKLNENLIADFKLYGDYFTALDIEEFEKYFINISYDKDSFVKVLEQVDLQSYLPELTTDEFLTLCFS